MKKKFFVILTVILMLLPLSVSAKDEWQYSKDTLTFGTTEYKKQEIPYTDGVLPDDFYVYKMKSESELFYAHAKADGYPLAFVSDYTSFVGDEYVYVNKEGEMYTGDCLFTIEEYRNLPELFKKCKKVYFMRETAMWL